MSLKEFFEKNDTVAIAFSGGVDSAYLLYAAKNSGAKLKAYYVKSDFQPQFELEDAKRLAAALEVEMEVLEVDILEDETIRTNPKNRCYFCKKRIFEAIKNAAVKDGYHLLLDGTNASDDVNDRPGMKALEELKVLSPLRICGLTKSEIRSLSKQAGLFTHDKPAYACLATRVKTLEEITKKRLNAIEKSEDYLFSMGFKDFRVRTCGTMAKLQLKEEQLGLLVEHREQILKELQQYFTEVVLDLEVRR